MHFRPSSAASTVCAFSASLALAAALLAPSLSFAQTPDTVRYDVRG